VIHWATTEAVAMIYSLSMAARPEGICVYLTGEIDISVSDHLYEVLSDALEQTLDTVEVNLQGLRMLDCTGISALLRARDDARRRGRVLFVSQPRGIVRRVLDLTGTLTVLTDDARRTSSLPFVHSHSVIRRTGKRLARRILTLHPLLGR
jgi:anti-anti-sigma factor